MAVGGYGRREQSLFSDIDVMLLHCGEGAEQATKAVLYPLWDANLKVGHSTRTVAECIAAAGDSLETLTGLLSCRLIAGDPALLERLLAALASRLKGRPLTPQLSAAERERRRADPYPLMAADIKVGRGGLRTFQSFYWERRRAAIIGHPPPHEATAAEQAAHEALLRVRNALHSVAETAEDRFAPDLREAAAKWLDVDLWELCELVTHSQRTAARLALQRWPDLMTEGRAGSPLRRWRRRISALPAARPARPLAYAAWAASRPDGVLLETSAQTAIRASGQHEWTHEDRAQLLELLDKGPRGRAAFGWLDSLGWVAANLPEYQHTIAAPQIASFHEHPVDTHLWRTVDEMRALVDGSDAWYADIGREVDDRPLLLLAAWLHDVGKAQPGDHSEVGAQLAEAMCRRIGFERLAAPVAELVRLHLLLAETATKRDTGDRRVLEQVADACGDLRTLQALYLLTVADAKATGRTMWSDWKATLLRNVFVRVARLLDPATAEGETRLESLAIKAGTDRESLIAHVRQMPSGYLDSHDDDEVIAHLTLAQAASPQEPAFAVLDEGQPAPRIVMVTVDQAGLLRAASGVLTIHGLEILDARLQTRADGVACDTFHVRLMFPDGAMPSVDDIARDLRAALDGSIDIDTLVAAKTAAYARPFAGLVVRTPIDPTLRFTAIEVRCGDRPGVLFDIVDELYDAGLDVRMARIDTRGDEVRDLFYVLRSGEPIRDVNELQPLIAALRAGLRQRLIG